jgi:hypothetical protein
MSEELVLKTISDESVPAALEKAERYRLLNDPEQAESICRDVLTIEPTHQEALRIMILALTDQFRGGHGHGHGGVHETRRHIAKLEDEYERAYYTGIMFEREARAALERSLVGHATAYAGFRQAMDAYEKAEALRPPGNDDAILRWNSCLRTIQREHLRPAPEDEHEQPLE